MLNPFLATLTLMKLLHFGKYKNVFSLKSFCNFEQFYFLRSKNYCLIKLILHILFAGNLDRYRPPDVLLGSKDYTTSLDIW